MQPRLPGEIKPRCNPPGPVGFTSLGSPPLFALILLFLILLQFVVALSGTFLGAVISSLLLPAGLLLLFPLPTALRRVVLSLVRIVGHCKDSFENFEARAS